MLFIFENKNKKIESFETLFLPSHFRHLTGFSEKFNGKTVSSINFYHDCLNDKISPSTIKQESSYAITKLEALQQLVQIDKIAKIVGEYDNGSGVLLQTNKVAGNINACIGFLEKDKYYIPNTILKEDIRKITKERAKIVAILKKNINEELYKKVTYLKNGYKVEELLKSIKNIKNLCLI